MKSVTCLSVSFSCFIATRAGRRQRGRTGNGEGDRPAPGSTAPNLSEGNALPTDRISVLFRPADIDLRRRKGHDSRTVFRPAGGRWRPGGCCGGIILPYLRYYITVPNNILVLLVFQVDRAIRPHSTIARGFDLSSAASHSPANGAPLMRTYVAKAGEVEKKWILIDADGLVVGRLADAHRHPPPRQAQADLHAARRLRRQRRRHQCREGRVHRQEAHRQDLLPPHRPSGRHQGARRRQDPRGQVPRARAAKRPSSA